MKEKIILAKPTKIICKIYPEYPVFYKNFIDKIKNFCAYQSLLLSDIWVRDFLPIQNLKTGKLFSFFYEPIYKKAKFKKLYKNLRGETSKYFPQAIKLSVYLDGGNFIYNKKGIGILFKNQNIFKNNSRQKITDIIKQKFSLKKVLWLPPLPLQEDPFCHIDGLMQFLGNDILCINAPYNNTTEKHLKKCLDILENKFKFVFLPTELNLKETLSAKGIYANFLETSHAVFVPKYNLKSDDKAAQIIQKYTQKPVISIDTGVISKYGGSLHCLTQNYFL